jgi:hypothetical protein
LHEEKHSEQRIWQLRGIKIDRSEESENARDSIRVNRESDSNKTDLSDLHEEKHSEQRIWRLRGIKIDGSDEKENALDSIRANREFDSNETEQRFFDSRKRQ